LGCRLVVGFAQAAVQFSHRFGWLCVAISN
jgi:Fe-S-cluster containining protein